MSGYASDTGMAPSIKTPGIGDYLTAHTVILAHANIYRMYEREFKEEQKGRSAAKTVLRQKSNTTYNKGKIHADFNPLIAGSYNSWRKTPYLPDTKKSGSQRWS
jgi:hypothetical protein